MNIFRQISLLALSLGLVLLLCNCKTNRVAHNRPPKPKAGETLTADILWKLCNDRRLDYKTLGLAGKMYIDAPSEGLAQMTVNYRIHLKKDSAIWIKLSLLGIEGGRMLITPDSVKVLDKQNRRAFLKSTKEFTEQLGLNVSFAALQDVLLGNPAALADSYTLADPKSNPLVLTAKSQQYEMAYTISPDTYKPLTLILSQPLATDKALLTYADFQLVEKVNFAHELDLKLPIKNGKVSGNLAHTKVELNPTDLTFAFSVPENYTIEK